METRTKPSPGQRGAGETRGGRSGTRRGRTTHTVISTQRDRATNWTLDSHVKFNSFSRFPLQPLQAQPTVCPRFGALSGSAAEEPAGESSEEAGGASGAAGESLSVQERSPTPSTPPGLRCCCTPPPHPEQGKSRQKGETHPLLTRSSQQFVQHVITLPFLQVAVVSTKQSRPAAVCPQG